MKTPALFLKPIDSLSHEIAKSFALGKPLTSDQINLLEWHEPQLSSAFFDPIYKYYIESIKKARDNSMLSVLDSSEQLTLEGIKKFKKRLQAALQKKATCTVMGFSNKQFLKFKKLTANELTFWHGNQFISGAPIAPGGITPVIQFQWGNLFGVARILTARSGKSLTTNAVLYFEKMNDRTLSQCVQDFNNSSKAQVAPEKSLLPNNKPRLPV